MSIELDFSERRGKRFNNEEMNKVFKLRFFTMHIITI